MRPTILVLLFLFPAIGGLILAGELTDLSSAVQEKFQKPNVIIIDLDRVNSDRMPCYGYERNTTPNLCKFGENNLMFEQAVSQAGWTAGSIASVFTSKYSEVHQVKDHGDRLDGNHTTLAEILDSKGYNTAAFPALPEKSPSFIHQGYNLDQGFQHYSKGGYLLEDNYRKFDEWNNSAEEPFFGFIQGFGAHRYAYIGSSVENHYRSEKIPEEFVELKKEYNVTSLSYIVKRNDSYYVRVKEDELIDLEEEDLEYVHDKYDDSIKQVDSSFGNVIKNLKDRDLYSNSIIIVFANHGEMLDSKTFSSTDRRFGHGKIWDDDIQVPLMIHLPEGYDQTIKKQVQLIDLLPTILQESNTEVRDSLKQNFQGESLIPLYENSLQGYNSNYAFTIGHSASKTAVRNSSWKLVKSNSELMELYNLDTDPNETNNIIAEHPNIAESLKFELERQQIQNQRLKAEILDTG